MKEFDENFSSAILPKSKIPEGTVVTILNYKIVEGWMLNPTYVSFSIQTKLPGVGNILLVDRRYSDFDWLRSLLVRDFPGIMVDFVNFVDSTNPFQRNCCDQEPRQGIP